MSGRPNSSFHKRLPIRTQTTDTHLPFKIMGLSPPISPTTTCNYTLSSGSTSPCVPHSPDSQDFRSRDENITFAVAVGNSSRQCTLYIDTECQWVFTRVTIDTCQQFLPGAAKSFACAGGGADGRKVEIGIPQPVK